MNTLIRALASILVQHGATRVLLVGGAVVDSLRGLPVKDWDLEVYGLSYPQLEQVLLSQGLVPNVVGKAFGIVKVDYQGLDVDLSIPRTENRVGVGHKGFEVVLDGNLSVREAARRRDLTINALAQDMVSGELIDEFGGLADLREGVLRATDPKTFVEDPLRVLRIMQLLPRKGETVSPDTIELCRSIVDTYSTLPSERVFEEFKKLLMKAKNPSKGLEFLRDSGWLIHFPELNALVGCPQKPEWHPEGDVWTHTRLVVDFAAQLREEVPEEWRLAYMFAAVLHDVGKPSTTNSELESPGHDMAGGPLAEQFMRRLTAEAQLIQRVVAIVSNHMQPGGLLRGEAGDGAWRRLHNRCPLQILAYMSHADFAGCGKGLQVPHRTSATCFDKIETLSLNESKVAPVLMGRHLIASGVKPGPHMKAMLDAAYQHQLDCGVTDLEVLLGVALKGNR